MKKAIKILTVLVLMFAAIAITSSISAQPNPNQNGNGSNTGTTPVGGGAPLDGGLIVMFALGAMYSIRKAKRLTIPE